MRWPARLTAAQLNGLGVALGVALIQAAATLLFSAPIGLAVSGGAVCGSLPDVPNPPQRTWRRVLPAALAVSAVTLAVGLCRASPWAMTALVGAIALASLWAMAWGPRAGPLSFACTLAMVFTLAWEPPASPGLALAHAGWTLLGATLYAVWAQTLSWALRRRYRELAVAAALRACADLTRSRAAWVAGHRPGADPTVRASIRDDAVFAEALQAARDLVFAARPSAHSRRLTDLVLSLIELRDLLLGSRLDLRLLGEDAASRGWRQALALALTPLADALDGLARAVADAVPAPACSAPAWRAALAARLGGVAAPADESRRPLVEALQSRLGHMLDDVAAMAERCDGPDRASAWSRESLQLFVSPEGWPLAALRPHLSLQSAVMRHAIRGALAMSLAYALGLSLPWATHPHWLVLSVAVVLRGSLEQTLSRRNERLIGTVVGCLLVLAVAPLPSPALLTLIFLLAVGVAHAYVNVRYRVAATAATLMALLQPLLLAPGSPPAVGERLADTVLGAALAWAFCFVLPSWERRTLARQAVQLNSALTTHAGHVLQWAPTPAQQLAQRLSRQQAYTALGGLAAAAQRSSVEPGSVRLPEAQIESLLSHGYRQMALLGAVQQTLTRRQGQLEAARLMPALVRTARACTRAGAEAVLGTPVGPAEASEATHALPGTDWPDATREADLSPWLLRRLGLCRHEAAALAAAALALKAAAEAAHDKAAGRGAGRL